MNKKGFTLVELLAVIVILALILAIAVPAISNVIQESRNRAYLENVSMIVKAAENYLISNFHSSPTNVGDSIQLSLSDLKTGNYISSIADFDSIGLTCNGYVVVTKTNSIDYEYIPHLKCGDESEIRNSTLDGLVAHYTFDTFKEYTSNVTNDPLISYNIPTNDSGGTFGNWVFSSWSSGFTHELVNSEIISSGKAIKITRGSSGSIADMWNLGWRDNTVSGKTYTLSFYAKGVGTARIANHWGGAVYSFNLTNNYQRYTFTFVRGSTGYFWIQMGSLTAGQWIQFEGFQVEEKSYATAYVTGVRNDEVIDVSGNGHHAILNSLTPTWTLSSSNVSGVYEFNGINNYISVGNSSNFNLSSAGTIAVWAKARNDYPGVGTNNSYRGIITKTANGNTSGLSYWIDWMGTNTSRRLRFGLSDGTSTNIIYLNNFNLNSNWVFIVASWDGNKLKLYINGRKEDETSQTIIPQILNANLEIGRAFGSLPYTWDGWIDDVMIYNRALSDYAIEKLYKTKLH